jgi:hypothetical protein
VYNSSSEAAETKASCRSAGSLKHWPAEEAMAYYRHDAGQFDNLHYIEEVQA